jgi:NAD(P)-dependent dehydrogenase (short-subunit alcohol dehydrogenase family)
VRINLTGKRIRLIGDNNPVTAAVLEALGANGAAPANSTVPDIELVSFPLLPTADIEPRPLLAQALATCEAMSSGGQGRLVFIVSAAAAMPMRRHPQFSVAMAAVLATVRTLAMAHGPNVLVNAVGVGAVGEPLIAGDSAMLGHASVKRSGMIGEVVDTVLFFCDPLNTYTTGQMLAVDGGWSAGYGRNF